MSDSETASEQNDQRDGERYESSPYQILLFVAGIILFTLVLGLVLDWYIKPDTPAQRKDLAQALGLITAGVAGAVGIFFTWRGQERNQRNTQEQFRLARQSQAQNQQSTQAQLENAQEELRLTRQGQITERFTRAIEQLGSDKLEIRLGGIYALERIDKESLERAYHPTVMEVLTAYVRENSRREHEERPSSTKASNEDGEQDAQLTIRGLPTDIRAIVDILRRRGEESVPEKHAVYLDLQGASLEGADLQGANLWRANLQGANFQGANLWKANLWRANLEQASLQETNLQQANLQGANLWRANLQEVDLQGVNLQGAGLQQADLRGAGLWRTNLQEADLLGADLRGADLLKAYKTDSKTDSIRYQLAWTIGSNETKLPDGLNQPKLWIKSVEEQRKILQEKIDWIELDWIE